MIGELDNYFDAAPRPEANAIQTGAFTLFISRTPWAYYARPTIGYERPITLDDLDELAVMCASHHVDLEIEWVGEVHPELATAAIEYGLAVTNHSLMVAPPDGLTAADVVGVSLRIVSADDALLAEGSAVAQVSFAVGGTAVGRGGAIEREESARHQSVERIDHLQGRHRRGLTVTAVAVSEVGCAVAVGSYQPVGDVAK